jgi:hypothetical protein
MWTPRRIALMLLGLAGFTVVFVVYSLFLGGIDGLPELPDAYARRGDDDKITIDTGPVSPTLLRLKDAFGPGCPEAGDPITYKTKLELRDKGMVFACGQPAFATDPAMTRFVTVSPFSLAFFGKPRPAHLRAAGEVTEISTFHADKAILEFDRPVTAPQDLNGKAKIVGMELLSQPDMPTTDPRRGRIWVTNNQRSADAGDHLVFRTPGPLFYRAPEAGGKPSPDAPQVWSTAAVEVVDRRNLPRPLRSAAPSAVPSKGDDLRSRNAVANILLGLTLPPPTITAEGVKMYLQTQDGTPQPGKKNATGYSGVRLIELAEKVQMNLWTDGSAGLPGDAPAGAPRAAAVDPPAAAGGVLGGFADGAAVARKLQDKSLLVIETLGRFRYDFQANLARFEAAVAANPAVANHVTVTRLSAAGGQDNLICKQLVVEFADKDAEPKAKSPGPAAGASGPAAGMSMKRMVATGEHVFLSVEADGMLAQGTELRYEVGGPGKPTQTVLKGSPVTAVRERNRLQGGDANTPTEVVLVSTPAATAKEPKRTAVQVRGPGRIQMYDETAKDTTLSASWGTSLTHEKELIGGRETDLLKFEGGGAFADAKGGFRLSADRMWLWLAAGGSVLAMAPAEGGKPAGQPLPQRLVAVGHVEGNSSDAVIRETDQLTVWFRDANPPPAAKPEPPAASTKPATPPAPAKSPVPQPVAPGSDPKKEEKAKPPVFLSARVIESWVARTPTPAEPPTPSATGSTVAAKPASPAVKYELERARCEDRVTVHQDPADSTKSRGTDIFGAKLNLDQSKAGSVLTVHGSTAGPAQVYFEDVSLFGPVVVIDQPNNAVSVDGQGLLLMPSGSELGGEKTANGAPGELEIQWSTKMRFFGAKATAEFLGTVSALQRPKAKPAAPPVARKPSDPEATWTRSGILCHRLDITFDRPVYFNQLKKDPEPVPAKGTPVAAKSAGPKLRSALCTPMPDDEAAGNPNARAVQFTEETFKPDGTYLKAQRVTARQIDLKIDDREQVMFATGPGQVRILQLGTKDGVAADGPRPPAAGPPTKAEDQEMKLTVVWFDARLVGSDKAKLFQEAVFDDGARVVQVPADRLDFPVVEHELPPRAVYLKCNDSMKVSSRRTAPGGVPVQNMTALGNAEFRTDEHTGNASKITYDGGGVVFDGTKTSPAKLRKQAPGMTSPADEWSGERIIYNRDGTITGTGTTGGAFTPGR